MMSKSHFKERWDYPGKPARTAAFLTDTLHPALDKLLSAFSTSGGGGVSSVLSIYASTHPSIIQLPPFPSSLHPTIHHHLSIHTSSIYLPTNRCLFRAPPVHLLT